MAEKTDLILAIHMTETTSSYDKTLRGSFDAYVYPARKDAAYDDDPYTWASGDGGLWSGFTLHAAYGCLGIADGRAYSFRWGFRPDDSLVRLQGAERFTTGLKKAQAAYDKCCKALGNPQTLGQQVVYLMVALGIKTACHKLALEPHPGITNGRLGGQSRDWRILTSMEDVRYDVDSTIEECRARQLDASRAA